MGAKSWAGRSGGWGDTITGSVQERMRATTSERRGRVIDRDAAASMEQKKQEGYF